MDNNEQVKINWLYAVILNRDEKMFNSSVIFQDKKYLILI